MEKLRYGILQKTEEQDKEIWKLKLELNMLTAQLKSGLGRDAADLAHRYLKLQTDSASAIVRWKTASMKLNSELTKANEKNIELEGQLAYAAQNSDPGRIEELQEQLDEEMRLRAEDRAQLEELEIALDEAKHNRPGDETLEQLEVGFDLSFWHVCIPLISQASTGRNIKSPFKGGRSQGRERPFPRSSRGPPARVAEGSRRTGSGSGGSGNKGRRGRGRGCQEIGKGCFGSRSGEPDWR